MSKSKAERERDAHNLEFSKSYIRETFPKGSKLKGYVVSWDRRSGTRRVIILGAYRGDWYVCGRKTKTLRVADISGHVARITGYRLNRDGEIIVPGYGFSATFEIISHLAQAIWGDSNGYEEDR